MHTRRFTSPATTSGSAFAGGNEHERERWRGHMDDGGQLFDRDYDERFERGRDNRCR